MKFIFANDTYINIDQILWVESRSNAGDAQMVVTIQFAEKKLTLTGTQATDFMREWYEYIAPGGK